SWSLPQNATTRIVAGGGAALIGLMLMASRLPGSRRRRRRTRQVPPAFHNLAGTAAGPIDPPLRDFDDLSRLDAAALRAIYPHATPRRWAVALRGSSLAVREHLAA